jgi:glycosyltransferase involved in cell wall biosynthesis
VKKRPRVVVAAPQLPFLSGGAERHVSRLVEELRARDVEAELVTLPFFEQGRVGVVKSALLWRLGDFTAFAGRPVDALIATRFPSYLASHPRKVVWLIHQYRQVYDQFGTAYSDFTTSAEDSRVREMIFRMDALGLTEARCVFANSRNVAGRLRHFNGIDSTPLYHPPPLAGRYRHEPPGDYALWVGRLDRWKRCDLAVGALRHAPGARLMIAGEGPEREPLERTARHLGVAARCEFLGRVTDEELLRLYAGARIVLVTAADEDYGYVPLEAFLSGKAVLTVADAGGPLEFVEDGRTGIVTAPDPEALGVALKMSWDRVEALTAMGEKGRAAVSKIGWDGVVASLLGAAGL